MVLRQAFLLTVFVIMPVTVTAQAEPPAGQLRLGWGSADLTPDRPAVIAGYSRARVSEGVLDPVTATALVIESGSLAAPGA